MLRMFAILIGLALIGFGVAGFLPQFRLNDLLFGQFEVNNLHNVIHIGLGILAIISAMSTGLTRLYFQLLGLFAAIVAIFGFVHNGDLIIMHVNMADNILHIAIAIIALMLGFVFNR